MNPLVQLQGLTPHNPHSWLSFRSAPIPLVTNDSDIGVEAALQGLGILYAFERTQVDACVAQGQLTQVLVAWSIIKPGLFIYYAKRRHAHAALGAFIGCLLDRDERLVGRQRKIGG